MHDTRTHPLLEQVPLTVSPFVQLPTAPTLPYTYKVMPSTLPTSSVGIDSTSTTAGSDPTPASSSDGPTSTPSKPRYVVSASGHAAHPDDIVASCRALQAHIAKLQADADAEIRTIEERIRARELAEKRRLAPGWLDSDARMLEPERKNESESVADGGMGMAQRFSGMSIAEGGNGGRTVGVLQQDGHGPGGASEMAVPDEGAEIDRVFAGR